MESNKDQFLVSTIVNGNEVKLYRELDWTQNQRYSYYIHWGNVNDPKTKQRLETPSGRKPSEGGAIKQFFKAVEAAKHLTFSKK